MNLYEELLAGKASLAVLGLGYVGLPLALEFAKKINVIGFDINEDRVGLLRNNIDPSREIGEEEFKNKKIKFTASEEELRAAKFFIVAVPTPVDEHKVPNLIPVKSASSTLGRVMKKGDYAVFESTVYPGCTEEDCLPIISKLSGLVLGIDFKLGYSPERINPGDKNHPLPKIKKVVSGSDAEALDIVAKVYEIVIEAGVHRATSIKVAEAAKIIENTQRDLNIALMNELAIIFDRMGINTNEVIEAASTKWNFSPYFPGLVGGHCIGVDPYYLTYKAKALGYDPEVILSGRRVNDEMSSYIAKKAVQYIIRAGKFISNAKVLIMGATFKENVCDIRNSKVADLMHELESFSINVHLTDPHASSQELFHEYGIQLTEQLDNDYDCIILAVSHDEYKEQNENYFCQLSSNNGILLDIKGVFRGKIDKLKYWSL